MKKARYSATFVGLLLACAALWVFGGVVFAADKPAEPAKADSEKADLETKNIVAESLSRLDWDNPDFKVQLVPLDGRKTYRVGDRVEFRFRTNRDGYVTIVDVGTSGKMHVLFPNRWQRDNRVEANRWYRIPPRNADYSFKVQGPQGVNYVKAIATTDRWDVLPKDADLSEDNPFFEFKDPNLAAKDIGTELGRRDRKGWTEDETKFRIVSWRDDRESDRYRDEDRDPDIDWDRPRRRSDRHREGDSERAWEWDRHSDRAVVKLWTDRKGYRIGEPVSFFFYSERDCYLNLVSFGTSGRARVIFPNRFQKDNFVRGGKVVEVPSVREDDFQFRVEGPPGTEVVKAIATRHKYHIYRGQYDWDRYAYQIWDEDVDRIEEDVRRRLSELPDDYYVRATTKFRVEP